jgi:hypothetical protein
VAPSLFFGDFIAATFSLYLHILNRNSERIPRSLAAGSFNSSGQRQTIEAIFFILVTYNAYGIAVRPDENPAKILLTKKQNPYSCAENIFFWKNL